MKTSLSGLDLISLSKELQELIGAKLDKIYQPAENEIAISLSSKGRKKIRVHARLDGWIWPTETALEMPLSPTSFAMQLRKRLANGTVTAISQHGCDRIIEMVIKREVEYRLIFEIFGEGNIVLVSADKIIASIRKRKWKHRELKPHSQYVFPPEAFDPRVVSEDRLADLTRSSKADIVRTLATRLNLGGSYAEEICKRANIEKEIPAASITEDRLKQIMNSIDGLVKDLEKSAYPHISYEDDRPIDVSPVKLLTDGERKVEEFRSFSEAIEKYVSLLPRIETDETRISEERQRLERTLATQESAIEEFRGEIDRCQKLAELIFANYSKTEEVIGNAKNAIETDSPIENIVITDASKGEFKSSIDGEEVILNWRKSVTENAQFYYEEVKKQRNKMGGAIEAIEDTKRKIEELEDQELIINARAQESKRKIKPTWFEKYRWFISSEDILVIAGKDARSNEQVVKKHLETGDRYVHAEIHGAPSVVVKVKEGMTEATLKEAGIFSLAMSKAWNSGIAAGSAYWVTPEQVSKTAESGEYIPRGAFIIRGKRNYFEKLELKLGIGICFIGSEQKIMCGPISAVSKKCSKFLEIVPGNIPKEKAAREISAVFSRDVAEIRSVLPPGNVKISTKKSD